MLSRMRDVRKVKGLTLADVAARCDPPTTAQTIGRLETGTRTLSIDWLNRIAGALGVDSSELVTLPDQTTIHLVARLSQGGAAAFEKPTDLAVARPAEDALALRVDEGVGDYRSGDVIWLDRLDPECFGLALNRDILAPRPAGRYLFGRLIGRDGGKLLILPPHAGSKQQVVQDPVWIGMATRLVRRL